MENKKTKRTYNERDYLNLRSIDSYLSDIARIGMESGDLSRVDDLFYVYGLCVNFGAKNLEEAMNLISEKRLPPQVVKDWVRESPARLEDYEISAVLKGYGDDSEIRDLIANVDEPTIRFHPQVAACQVSFEVPYNPN